MLVPRAARCAPRLGDRVRAKHGAP